ncbi:hypothetical protein PINS_up000990 [Pythium insidiosum]|nr:hypothetical protein PINS_up000990 [Pythium insidiosum]
MDMPTSYAYYLTAPSTLKPRIMYVQCLTTSPSNRASSTCHARAYLRSSVHGLYMDCEVLRRVMVVRLSVDGGPVRCVRWRWRRRRRRCVGACVRVEVVLLMLLRCVCVCIVIVADVLLLYIRCRHSCVGRLCIRAHLGRGDR